MTRPSNPRGMQVREPLAAPELLGSDEPLESVGQPLEPSLPVVGLGVFMAAYVVAGGLGQGLALIPGVAITFWPPAGIFVAALLLNPRRTWPWWIGAACLAELSCNALWFHNAIPFALVYFGANVATAVAAAWLVGRFAPRALRLRSLEEVLLFALLAAGVAPMASATVIATTDELIGKHTFFSAWWHVWIGDGTGLLVSMLPTYVAVQTWRRRGTLTRRRVREATAVGLMLLVLGLLTFRGLLPTPYVLMPLVLWAAARFQLRGAAVTVPLIAVMAAAHPAVAGAGLPPDALSDRIVSLQVFLGVSAVSAWLVAALSAQRQAAQDELHAANADLEHRVAARTSELVRFNAELEANEEALLASGRQLRARNDQLALLARVSHLLILGDRTDQELLTAVFGEVAAAIGAEVYVGYEPFDATSMRLCNWGGLTDDERTSFSTLQFGELLCGRVAERREALVVEDIAHTDVEGSEALRAAGYGAYAGFPLLADEQLLGTIAFVTRTKTHYGDGEVRMIQSVCDQVAAMLHRQRLAQRLRASDERHRLALDGADLGAWDVDLSSGETVWSRRHYELQGLAPESAAAPLGPWPSRVHPSDAQHVAAQFAAAREGRTPVSVEHRVLRADTGELRWLSLYGRFTYDADGHAVRLSGVAQDITARKEAEFALVRAHQRLETALHASQVILFHQDRELRYTWIHNTALGDRLQEVVGRRDLELFERAEDALRTEALKRQVLETGLTRREEVCVVQGGEPRYYDLVLQADLSADGEIQGINGAGVDVTERKKVEADLKFAAERAEIAQEAAHAMLYEFHPTTGVAFRTAAIVTLVGYSSEELPGTGEAWRTLIHPDDLAQAWDQIEHGLRHDDGFALEYRVVHKDGHHVWVRDRARIVRDTSGRPERVVGMVVDITVRKEIEDRLREQDRHKDEFLATLAHELRNPLAPIRNGLQIMELGGVDEETLEEVRDMMARHVEQMTHLIDDLMDVSRISRGKIVLQTRRVDLREAIRNAVDTCRALIDDQRHELTIDLPYEPLHVEGDLTRLSQVFANLLNNSAKYTDPGGHIGLTAEREGEAARVRVRDDGIGIAAPMLPTVFDLFTQVERSAGMAQGGLGIGLHIVRRLVEMHGGSIVAHSDGPGAGSTFAVTLPLATAATEPAPVRPAPPVARGSARRVLVVDDNVDAATSLAKLLQLSGHEARVAHDGGSALAAARSFAPEVVFCDLGMPGMDGCEVARRLRADGTIAQATLVALTGWGGDADRRRSAEAGFDVHLTKPVELASLQDVLTRAPAVPSG
jgi:PAS domain S-box-containing protein